MRYSAKVLEQLLLKLQSLYYDRYKNCTIKDALTLLLNQESIADYNNIEWTKFKDDLIGFYPLPTARELRQDPFCEFNPQSKLEEFIKGIVPAEERVRVLSFFRDNADEVLFNNEDGPECHDFKKECARLISQCIEDGKRTVYHGDFEDMAHPSLEAIANAKPLPALSKEEQIIADNIPHYPHEEGLFSYEAIIYVAKVFIANFLRQLDVFNRTQEDKDKPCMSIQKYKDPIRDGLISVANRYLYFETNPIYQVIWVMGVLIRLKPKQDWWTKNFADNIVNYLDCTKFLCDTKKDMDNAIDQVKRLTELSLFDEPATQQPTKSKECAIHRDMNVMQIVDGLVAQIQQHHQDAKNVQVTMNFEQVGQVYANAENMDMYAEKVEHVHNTQTEQPATPPKYTSYCTYIVPNAGKSRDEIETDIIRTSKKSGNVFAMFLNNYEEKGYLDFRGEPKSDIFSYLKERYHLPYDIENFRKFFKPKTK